MTNATTSTRTVTEHRFHVPCTEPHGGDMQALGVAMSWARNKAEEIGLNTHSDDWASLHVGDEELVIVVTEKRDGAA